MPERTTTTNDAKGKVDFGSITFTLDDLLKALPETQDATDEADGTQNVPTTNAPEATPDDQAGKPSRARRTPVTEPSSKALLPRRPLRPRKRLPPRPRPVRLLLPPRKPARLP